VTVIEVAIRLEGVPVVVGFARLCSIGVSIVDQGVFPEGDQDFTDGRALGFLSDRLGGQMALIGQPLGEDAVIAFLGVGRAEPAEIDFFAVDADSGLS
jgi:hypothetical protein